MPEREKSLKNTADATFTPRRYLSLLQDNSTFVCIIVLTITLIGLIIAYSLPKRYEASSTVFIEHNVISDLVKGIAITPSIDSKMRILQVSLQSRAMLLKVAAELDMDLHVGGITDQEALIQSMRSKINIKHDEKKGLFFIAYIDSRPALARDFVNSITRLYIEENTASKRKESYDATSFLNEQIQVFQKRIEAAQAQIDAFKSEEGMYLGLNDQLLRQQIKSAEQRLEDIRIQKAGLKAEMEMLTPNALRQEELRKKEEELQRLLAMYTERHPAVLRTKEDIRSLKKIIADEKNNPNPTTSTEYQKARLNLASLEEFESNMRAELVQNTKDLQELPAIRTDLAALEQRKANETLIYEQLVARFGQSEVSKQMELQDKSVTFRVIDPAVLPTQYISPQRPLIILGGILGGIFIACGILVLIDLLRPKIRSPKDIEAFNLEILAKLPRIMPPERVKSIKRQYKIVAATAVVLLFVSFVALLEAQQLPYAEKAFYRISRTLAFWS